MYFRGKDSSPGEGCSYIWARCLNDSHFSQPLEFGLLASQSLRSRSVTGNQAYSVWSPSKLKMVSFRGLIQIVEGTFLTFKHGSAPPPREFECRPYHRRLCDVTDTGMRRGISHQKGLGHNMGAALARRKIITTECVVFSLPGGLHSQSAFRWSAHQALSPCAQAMFGACP